MPYIGRFAPSPTGALHPGTLLAAALSFLHARQNGGRWLVRIEDIDPPREVPGSATGILRSLERLSLHWDGEVRFQSSRHAAYRAAADSLLNAGLAFRCCCSRQDLRLLGDESRYPGTCRDAQLGPDDTALRLRVDGDSVRFHDGIRGWIERDVARLDGDFVIFRRDGLPAYHLAVVLDDADQGVTDVVRGGDLLECTPLHILLQRQLQLPTPRYWHVPVLTDARGEKLSKRAGATAIDRALPGETAAKILRLLGLTVPAELSHGPAEDIWSYAIERLDFADLATRPANIVFDNA